MAKISDRNMPGWASSPEFTDLPTEMDAPLLDSIEGSNDEALFQGNQSQYTFPFSKNKRMVGVTAASLFSVTAILFSLQHPSPPQVGAVNSTRSVALISELSRPSQVPMQQVHVLDQTFVKVLRIPKTRSQGEEDGAQLEGVRPSAVRAEVSHSR